MATLTSLSSLFENPLPENPTLIESLSSWNHHKSMKPIETSSFAEIFGELYFQEKPGSYLTKSPIKDPVPPSPSTLDSKDAQEQEKLPMDSVLSMPKNRFANKSSESLQMCTEGLGSESSDDVDDLLESGNDWRSCGKAKLDIRRGQLMYSGYSRRSWDVKSSKSDREFPPPISSIGKSGKPWVCLKSYREDGRFVLREIRIPNQELLHASREDGRLKLHFVRHEEDILEGEGEEEKDDDVDGEDNEEQDEEKVNDG